MLRRGLLILLCISACRDRAPNAVTLGQNSLIPCTQPTDCTNGNTCFNGFCRKSCGGPADCDATHESCNGGVCLRWLFERVEHGLGDMTITDVWARSDGVVFATGWYGTIITNRDGSWQAMSVPTREHLTGIFGVENGAFFNLPAVDGEMFAVGHNGTLLYYNPNPACFPVPTAQCNPQPTPQGGAWQLVGGPGQAFASSFKIDPYCPDYDGDGIADDGGGTPVTNAPDGWWRASNTCVGGATATCDDNCRTTPNGPDRPLQDTDNNSCIQSGVDSPYGASRTQTDGDSDGVGYDCDPCEDTSDPACIAPPGGFARVLFDVWAQANGNQLSVIAVGEDGAAVTYEGPNGSLPAVVPALPVSDRGAWVAQESVPYRYTNDCPLGTAAGTTCAQSPRLPPSCPAQCSPYRSACPCPIGQFQCCVAGGGLTGAACNGAACGGRAGAPADNACQGTGSCSSSCPSCQRRLDRTLRSVTSDGTTVVAVGAAGAVATLDLAGGLTGVWTRPDCATYQTPLDQQPVYAGVSQSGGLYHLVGALGAVAIYPDTGPCALLPLCGAPPAFLSGVFATSGQTGYAVGDRGTLLTFDLGRGGCFTAPPDPVVAPLDTGITENFFSVWVDTSSGQERLWIGGASGVLVRGALY